MARQRHRRTGTGGMADARLSWMHGCWMYRGVAVALLLLATIGAQHGVLAQRKSAEQRSDHITLGALIGILGGVAAFLLPIFIVLYVVRRPKLARMDAQDDKSEHANKRMSNMMGAMEVGRVSIDSDRGTPSPLGGGGGVAGSRGSGVIDMGGDANMLVPDMANMAAAGGGRPESGAFVVSGGSVGGAGGGGDRHSMAVGKSDADADALLEAERQRQATKQLGMMCSLHDIGDKYGIGNQMYFHFLNQMALFCAVTGGMSALVWAGGFQNKSETDDAFSTTLFTSAYGPEMRAPWTLCGIFTILLACGFGVHVYKYDQKKFDKLDQEVYSRQRKLERALFLKRKGGALPRRTAVFLRRLVAYYIFIVAMVGFGCLYYYLGVLSPSEGGADGFKRSCVVGLMVAGLNVTTKYTWIYYTKWFEAHRTPTSVQKHTLIKLTMSRLMSFAFVSLGQHFAQENVDVELCTLDNKGRLVMFLLLSELVFENLMEIALRASRRYVTFNMFLTNLDVTHQYSTVFYTFFGVLIGMPVFPLAGLFGALVMLLEIAVDKYSLLHWTKTERFTATLRKPLTLSIFVYIFVAAVLYPYGILAVLSGIEPGSENCEVYAND